MNSCCAYLHSLSQLLIIYHPNSTPYYYLQRRSKRPLKQAGLYTQRKAREAMSALPQFTLISHKLCPYVQRAAIILKEQNIPYKRIDVDLDSKPDWFLKLSPLGKVPVLLVDDEDVIFESAAIGEYVNEITRSGLLDEDPLEKAKQRAWIEFASSLVDDALAMFEAKDEIEFKQVVDNLRHKLRHLERNFFGQMYFIDDEFSLVDVAFAPALRNFEVLADVLEIPLYENLKYIPEWHRNLMERESVVKVVNEDFPKSLMGYVVEREGYLADRVREKLDRIQAA